MSERFEQYRNGQGVPRETWTWNMYGAGIERIGREGKPERFPVPAPGPDQLLVRVDAVGMCFSDTKLIKQGGKHPKLYNRDLEHEPTVLGHEVALTVIQPGEKLAGQYHRRQRLALQPDIYDEAGRSTAFGYTIRGGLTQYLLLGPEVLDVNGQCFVLPIEGEMGYAEASLTEPWACVEGAYSQRRRLEPLARGKMWIVGLPGDATPYTCMAGLSAPDTFVLTDVHAALAEAVRGEAARRGAVVIVRDALRPADYDAIRSECTGGVGFDDVIVLGPRSPEMVGEAARIVARRGTFNVVGARALPGLVQIDVGRIHYDYIAYLGNAGPDAGASYGEARNRCELRGGGVAVFVGAAGPMGQMHVQRALELEDGPRTVIGSDVNPARLAAMVQGLGGIAQARGKKLVAVGPGEDLGAIVACETGGRGADDVVVSVPVAEVMAQAAEHMAEDGMLVFFAGVPNGTYASLDLAKVYLHGAQYTGTSGSALSDQALVIQKAQGRQLSPARSVGAVGGMEAAVEGVRAMLDGRFAGKVIIFPQVQGLPLTGLDELWRQDPAVAQELGQGGVWTNEAEQALLEKVLEAVIYTLTSNPALDRELRVPSILFGEVLRASASRTDPGGKGFNVSRALRGLDAESVAVGLVGGFAGQQIAASLQGAGIAVDFVQINGETRTNVTVVDDTNHIKVNEAGPTVSVAEQQRLVEKVRSLARAGDWWVISGSLPPGAAPDLYAEIVRIVNAAGARALLDASGPPLARGCAAAPFLVKPNSVEAAELTGIAVDDEAGASAAAERIHAMGVAHVVISMGKRGAVLSNGARAWVARPPSIVERNPIGAGDSMVAGLVWGLSRGLPIEEALRWGVGSGAAAASLDGTAFGTRAQVEELERKVELIALPARLSTTG